MALNFASILKFQILCCLQSFITICIFWCTESASSRTSRSRKKRGFLSKSYLVDIELVHERIEAGENSVHWRYNIHCTFDCWIIEIAQFAEKNWHALESLWENKHNRFGERNILVTTLLPGNVILFSFSFLFVNFKVYLASAHGCRSSSQSISHRFWYHRIQQFVSFVFPTIQKGVAHFQLLGSLLRTLEHHLESLIKWTEMYRGRKLLHQRSNLYFAHKTF